MKEKHIHEWEILEISLSRNIGKKWSIVEIRFSCMCGGQKIESHRLSADSKFAEEFIDRKLDEDLNKTYARLKSWSR